MACDILYIVVLPIYSHGTVKSFIRIMVNLSIGTFNVKGLANDKKRKEIFYWLKEKNEYLFSAGNTLQ